MDQIPISEDRSIVVNMITPPKEQVIDVGNKDTSSTFTSFGSVSAGSKTSVRMSISEKGGEKDRILWNSDTGRVNWDFIDVKEKKGVEVKLEWEVVAGDRAVHSHFGDKI
jgi:hypothetical protein